MANERVVGKKPIKIPVYLAWMIGIPILILAGGVFFWLGLSPWGDKPSASVQVGIASITGSSVVAWFAIISSWHARRQANISNRAVQVALDAQRNASMPVIRMRYSPASNPLTIDVPFKNVGPGPALRFQCWLESKELKVSKQRYNFPAIGPGEEHSATWPKEHAGQNTANASIDIIAQYEDIFGQTFESIYHIDAPIDFSYRKLADSSGDRRSY